MAEKTEEKLVEVAEPQARPRLEDLDLPLGKRTRLHRLLYEHGPGNGTLLLLPIDHGLEHGPRDFFVNPPSGDPEYQLRLAREGGFSGIVFHIGIAQKYMRTSAGQVPLVLKLNGKTNLPSDEEALSPVESTVEDAVRLGADAVGYTLYVGSPRQDEDFVQLGEVRAECDRYAMPLIVWSYPRGRFVDGGPGRNSLYSVDYAARVASELGADCIKLNFPQFEKGKKEHYPKEYRERAWTPEEMMRQVVQSAGKAMVLVSGGSKKSDDDLLEKARIALEAGSTGFLFGRNLWQRPFEDGLAITQKLKELMRGFGA
ncbi:MAG: class I fructose-bisphosphate aldolase [Anaerolineae bacterium]